MSRCRERGREGGREREKCLNQPDHKEQKRSYIRVSKPPTISRRSAYKAAAPNATPETGPARRAPLRFKVEVLWLFEGNTERAPLKGI